MRLDLDVYINPLQQGSTGMLYHDQSPEQVVWFTVREEKPKESTMKILRRGIPKSEHLFEGECSHCKSVMQEKRGNLKPTQDQRDGEFAHATCPVCGADFVMHPCGGYCAGTK